MGNCTATESGEENTEAAAASYFSLSAASNPYRQYQWYLDGYLTPGSNANGANVDKISTEYTGHGVKIGLIDTGFDLSTADLANRFRAMGSAASTAAAMPASMVAASAWATRVATSPVNLSVTTRSWLGLRASLAR